MEHKMLFLYNRASTFIDKDIDLFKNLAQVASYECKIDKRFFRFILSMIREFVFISKNVFGTDMIYCWFADYHALLPAVFSRITRKPFYMVLGGYDVNYLPELGYGSFSNGFRAFCARFAIKAATLNLPVSENLAKEAIRRAGKIPVHILPTGYDPDKIKGTIGIKENMVITAALVHERQTFMVKGIDRFLELARIAPEFDFTVIGIDKELISYFDPKPDNLRIIPPVSQNELYSWFDRAKFYAQFSRSEGMPNALCEAMLMECIPLGMNAGGIAAVIHDTGLVLDKWMPLTAKAFLLEHIDNKVSAQKARNSIIERFHYSKRNNFLAELLRRL